MGSTTENHIDPRDLPYDETIADLTRRLEIAAARVAELEALRHEVAELEADLDWWRRGRERYGTQEHLESTELVPEEVVLRTVPKPTLAQALVRIIATGQPGKTEWTVAQIMAELRDRGWMPNGTSAGHVVRARLAQLARGDDASLRRVGHGIYALNDSPNASIVPAEGR